MATFMDVAGLQAFSDFFVFLFVWLLVWALARYTKIMGDNDVIGIVAGLVVALFVLITPTVSGIIRAVAPWIGIILVFIVIISVVMKSFGAVDAASIAPLKTVGLVFIIVAVIVGAASQFRESVVVPGDSNFTGTQDYQQTSQVFFHPKMLGMVFIMAVAIFTIALLVNNK